MKRPLYGRTLWAPSQCSQSSLLPTHACWRESKKSPLVACIGVLLTILNTIIRDLKFWEPKLAASKIATLPLHE